MRDSLSASDASAAWRRLQAGAALSAALLSIGLGLLWAPPETMTPHWPWVEALGPLDRAPIPPGTRVMLVPPPGAPQSEQPFWLYEARWRRPDVLWSALDDWRLPDPPALGVAVRLGALPPGWHEVWRRGDLCLARWEGTR